MEQAQQKKKQDMFIINKEEAEKKSLAITSEGMHFKGQYISKKNYFLFGKKVNVLGKAFNYVYRIEYNGYEYFISEDLCKDKI